MSMYRVDHCPDSFAYLKTLPDDCVDVTITDPPYSEHVQKNLCSGSLVGTKNVPKYELPFAPLTNYEFLGDLLRVTKRWVVVFCCVEDFGMFKAAQPEAYVRGCIWIKLNAMGQLTADRPATNYEGIALLHKTKGQGGTQKRWNGKGSYGSWVCNGTRGEKGHPDGELGRHPNQKPLALCQKLVALFSERGETILDPFCGSGRIGEAALSLDRNYAGFDNDPGWAAEAMLPKSIIPLTDDYALSLCAVKECRP